jgi:hypothetical protein
MKLLIAALKINGLVGGREGMMMRNLLKKIQSMEK